MKTPFPLRGTWTVGASHHLADRILPSGAEVTIETDDGANNYSAVTSSTQHAWAIDYQTELMICGTVDVPEYGFVITVGGHGSQRGVLGILFERDTGGGSDPGTWEADGSGTGGGGRGHRGGRRKLRRDR